MKYLVILKLATIIVTVNACKDDSYNESYRPCKYVETEFYGVGTDSQKFKAFHLSNVDIEYYKNKTIKNIDRTFFSNNQQSIRFYQNGAIKEYYSYKWDKNLKMDLFIGYRYFYRRNGCLEGIKYYRNDSAFYGVFYDEKGKINENEGKINDPFVNLSPIQFGKKIKYGFNDTLKIVAITPPTIESILYIYVVNMERVGFEVDSFKSLNNKYSYIFDTNKYKKEELRSLYFLLKTKGWPNKSKRNFNISVFLKE